MAKIQMTIEDITVLGKPAVRVTLDPSGETIIAKKTSGHQWTHAEGYAMAAANFIKEISKAQKPSKIIVERPRIELN